MASKKLNVFALTGGIASGKSTVAEHLRARGVPVIDADQLARDAVAPGTRGLAQVIARFGADMLTDAGELDRPHLGQRVFASPQALNDLNAIVHPIVRSLLAGQLTQLEADGQLLACYEVPLLFENNLESGFRPVVLVYVSRETQIARAMKRNGFSASQAAARVDAQMPANQKRSLSDFVIDNEGTLASTQAQTDTVLDQIRAYFSVGSAP